jgi:hypothetical protein
MPPQAKVVADRLVDFLFQHYQPYKKESVVDWVEHNVELPTGAITGKVSMKMAPYGREILEHFADRRTRHLVLCFATQSIKTTLLTLGLLYKIARMPEDALWVMGNQAQARDFSKERLQPFVRLCRPVYDLVPKTERGIINKHLWGFTAMHFTSMVLNLVGAGSPIGLSSRPRGLLILDETDKYYDELKYDAGTIQLAEERQKTFPFPLSVKASTPTTIDRMIWVEYMKTDQRKYWLPCPRCGKEIILRFSIKSEVHGDCGLRWWRESADESKTDGAWDMKKVAANAYYRCQECTGEIYDYERPTMLEAGRWVPTILNAEPYRFGYHLSSLYSILSQATSLGNIAVQWLTARGLRSELQSFVNSWLAEPWDESRLFDRPDIELEEYSNKQIPENSVGIMGIDFQEGHQWVVIRRFQAPDKEHPHGRSWLLYADRVETIDELSELQTTYGIIGENILCDLAHRPNQVGKTIIEKNWRGILGTDTKSFQHPQPNGTRVEREYSVVQFRDPYLGTKWQDRTFERVRYVKFSKPRILDMVSSLRWAQPTIWHVSMNAHLDYSRHLNSRVKLQRQNQRTGVVEWFWKELHQDNHLADCENFVTVRALQLGLLAPPKET